MSTVRRVVVLGVFGLFALTLVLRPVSRFLTSGFTGDGFDTSVLFLSVPGLVVALVMLAVSLSVLAKADGDSETGLTDAMTVRQQREVENETPQNAGEPVENGAESPDAEQQHPSFLGGQGGTRNKGFEIEEQPPETELDDHLSYLRERLGEESIDVETVDESSPENSGASGSEKTEEPNRTGGPEIPDQCPQEYCDANWRGLLGGSRNYERLDERGQVRCEVCGSITILD